MSLVQRPKDFDVVLTENMFGDILSDQAGGVVGSLGSAGLGQHRRPCRLVRAGARLGSRTLPARESRIHWARFLPSRLLLRHSFQLEREAGCIEDAVSAVLNAGSAHRRPGRARRRSCDFNVGDGTAGGGSGEGTGSAARKKKVCVSSERLDSWRPGSPGSVFAGSAAPGVAIIFARQVIPADAQHLLKHARPVQQGMDPRAAAMSPAHRNFLARGIQICAREKESRDRIPSARCAAAARWFARPGG